ncbi:hypothetical protein [Flavobacterium subsaxonicum]|uniref:Lipoprotein n=1 Tax=Flavobacterium subsaxonicum WB 4.1-42 = DSM 21790 TaxID=1121898 RepID=A0A0A2MIZ5_9FLAO|nr:hypothetical protein [Flavobacterium subsaxonicum]KGO92249.1 hypothetical protein Q766_13910 [Flavobacterium subsaxonicum WB 4.1-42 = DSM 21790]
MKIKLLLAAFVVLFITSCQEQPQLIKVKGRYSLELPASFSLATNLNDHASLQYQDINSDFYVIVLDEDKRDVHYNFTENDMGYTTDFKGYCNYLTESLNEGTEFDTILKLKPLKINKRAAATASITGTIDSIPVYWKLAYVEGKNYYYQIITWTHADNREKHDVQMEKIVQSFKETDKSKKRK